MPSRRLWTFQDLTPENIKRWKKSTHWPIGIKLDLSRLSEPELPSDELLLHQSVVPTGRYVITAHENYARINVHKWWFPHPRRTVPAHPRWVKGPGFCIPEHDAYHWVSGITRLLESHPSRAKGWDNLTLYELRYNMYRVKFFFQEKQGSPHAQIQTFYRDKKKEWGPSNKMFCWRVAETAFPEALLAAVKTSAAKSFCKQSVYSQDCEIVNVEEDAN